MTKTINPLRLALADALVPAGYTRKGDSWFRRAEDVIEVVNLQKSQWGPQYYLNYALWLRALGETLFPREEMCHMRMRADDIISSKPELARILNLESPGIDNERRSEFVGLLTSEFVPFVAGCRTLGGLRALLEAGKLKSALILVDARRLLTA